MNKVSLAKRTQKGAEKEMLVGYQAGKKDGIGGERPGNRDVEIDEF